MCCSCQSPTARRRQCDTLQSVSTSSGQSNLSTSTLLHHPFHHDPHSSSTVSLNSHKLCISQLLDFTLGLCISVMTHHLSLQQSLLSRFAQVFTIFDWASALHSAFHLSVYFIFSWIKNPRGLCAAAPWSSLSHLVHEQLDRPRRKRIKCCCWCFNSAPKQVKFPSVN